MEGGGVFAPISREGGLLINNLLLTTATATVLLGTLYPLITEVLELGRISVGLPYFNGVFIPLMVPLIALMGIGPLLAWKRGDLGSALSRLKVALGLALAAGVVTLLIAGFELADIGGAFGITMAVWLAASAFIEWAERVKIRRSGTWARIVNLPRAAYGMTLAHLGMAVLIFGVSGASAWKTEAIQVQAPGESVQLAGYTLTFQGVTNVQGPNYRAEQATIEIRRGDRLVETLRPERRSYIQPPDQTTFSSIYTTYASDLLTTLGEADGANGAYVTRYYHEPLVPFLWYGILMMGLGGIVSLTDRRHRVGAPRRAAATAAPGSPLPQAAE
jgi:cytochrome c-type biogenesis protein CcmF